MYLGASLLSLALLFSFQERPAASAAFEVASIRPSGPNDSMGMFPSPGTLRIGSYTLRRLVQESSDLMAYQVVGGPAWVDEDKYTIVGKAAVKANFHELIGMLVPLLKERFQLRMHRESRQMNGYALVVVKSGPKIKPANKETVKGRSFAIHGTQLSSWDLDMKFFAHILAGQLRVPVVDETRLDGRFQFTLRYAPEEVPGDAADPAFSADPGPGSIFTAIQEQLGLRLEQRKVSVPVIVIDHVERPSPN